MPVDDKVFRLVVMGLIGLLIAALVSLTFRSTTLVFDLPLTEDGYYVQTIARNIARGVGFSVDGSTLTNGFHPLWAVLSSLVFVTSGDSAEAAVRILLALGAATAVGSAFFWSSIAGAAFDAKPALYRPVFVLVYLGSFQLLAQHFNGLETGLMLLMFALLGLYWSRVYDYRTATSMGLGLLLGFLILTRIDAAIFACLVGAEAAWRLRREPVRLLGQTAIMGTAALVIAAPWFVYNLALTGKLMPVSGLALGLGGDNTPLDRVVNSAGGIARNSFPFIIGEINRPASLVVFVLAAGLAVFLYRQMQTDPEPKSASTAGTTFTRRSQMYMGIVVLYVAIQVVVYTLTSAAAFFYPRYFILMAVLAAAVFAYLL